VLSSFKSVLNAIQYEGGGQLLNQLDFLSNSDRKMISQWNQDVSLKVDDCTVHELFQKMAASQPNWVAIQSWDGKLTYFQLDKLSNKLSQYLRGLGVGPETMVVHYFPKSMWAVVAILAILKAGGACVATTPDFPRERVETIIAATNASVVRTSSDTMDTIDGLALHSVAVHRQFIESIQDTESTYNQSISVAPHNAAFVIFTSGSTGNPKGIIMNHSSLCASMKHLRLLSGMCKDSRVLQFSAYTFDVHIFDIFVTLYSGGCVCIASDHERSNELSGVINRLGVNFLSLTPTVAALIDPTEVPTVTKLAMMGEAVTKGVVDSWYSIPGLRLYNGYGPAETWISSWTEISPESTAPKNIGFAIGGDRFWVADPLNHHRLMPVGCRGELLIEGPTLARGYLNMPQRTVESFIKRPPWLQEVDGATPGRVYKTGDLVRYNTDGSLNYFGRKDTQVKVHGQRVELDEIDYHLNRTTPKIAEGFIVYASKGPCNKRLVALVARVHGRPRVHQASQANPISLSQDTNSKAVLEVLKNALESKLPSYMIPTLWVLVNEIPITASGKTHRLIIPRWVHDMDMATYHSITGLSCDEFKSATPENSDEQQIRSVWSQVLKLPVERVGTDRTFISLGGDSIVAMKVVSLLGRKGLRIVVKDLMLDKNIQELGATAVQLATSTTEESKQVTDQPRRDLSWYTINAWKRSLHTRMARKFRSKIFTTVPQYSREFFLRRPRLVAHIKSDTWQRSRRVRKRHPWTSSVYKLHGRWW
jgi:amino acid adenylation domain-containing protein